MGDWLEVYGTENENCYIKIVDANCDYCGSLNLGEDERVDDHCFYCYSKLKFTREKFDPKLKKYFEGQPMFFINEKIKKPHKIKGKGMISW